MVKPDGFKGSFFRPNLLLWAHKKGDGRGSRKDILAYVRRRRGESGIIYTLSRRNVESLTAFLRAGGVAAAPYHAGLEPDVRARHQEAFARDQVDVIVATIAFGMGIDKSNVRYVIHREMPRSIESYYQEIGRAGRDGLASDCILLYSWADVLSHARVDDGAQDAGARAADKPRAMFALADRGRLPPSAPGRVLRRDDRAVRRVLRPLPRGDRARALPAGAGGRGAWAGRERVAGARAGAAALGDAGRRAARADVRPPQPRSPPRTPSSSALAHPAARARRRRRRARPYIVFSDAVLLRIATARPSTRPTCSRSRASGRRSSPATATRFWIC